MTDKPTITIGIDPGYAIVGWAIISKYKNKLETLDYGVIETHKDEKFSKRLEIIYTEINKTIKKYKPTTGGIEQLYFAKNTTTALNVGHARGVIMLVLEQNNINIKEYTPLQIKQSIASYGRADKKQMQKMIQNILKLPKLPQPDDAADALAIAWMRSEDNIDLN